MLMQARIPVPTVLVSPLVLLRIPLSMPNPISMLVVPMGPMVLAVPMVALPIPMLVPMPLSRCGAYGSYCFPMPMFVPTPMPMPMSVSLALPVIIRDPRLLLFLYITTCLS